MEKISERENPQVIFEPIEAGDQPGYQVTLDLIPCVRRTVSSIHDIPLWTAAVGLTGEEADRVLQALRKGESFAATSPKTAESLRRLFEPTGLGRGSGGNLL